MRIYFGEDARGPYVSLSDGQNVITTEYGKPKEDLIAVMDRALQHAKKGKSDIREVAVDRGPGGFSAVRRRVAVATSLALSLGAAIAECGAETAEEVAQLPSEKFSVEGVVAPLYVAEPNITKSKRDSYV